MSDGRCLDAATVARLYLENANDLLRFLRAVLRDEQLAQDVLQTAFARVAERGGEVAPGSLRSWLFQVAYREALALRRQRENRERLQAQRAADLQRDGPPAPEEVVLRREVVDRVRAALESLPPEQRLVVRARIYEGKKFAEIARELGIPLGTVLSRMRAAMARLRAALADDTWREQE